MLSSIEIASYGAVLSTLLAAVKFGELWRDRLRVSVSIGWNNLGPDITEVQITNHHKNLITISLLELYWAKNTFTNKHKELIDLGMETGCFIEIPAFSTKRLKFNEQFAFGPRGGKFNLYAKIYIAGRRSPITGLAYKGQ